MRSSLKKITNRTGRAFGGNEILDNIKLLSNDIRLLEEGLAGVNNRIKSIENRISEIQVGNERIKEALIDEQNNFSHILELIQTNCDITRTPEAHGLIKINQLGNLKILSILKEIFNSNKLSYYIDYGTLLGAVRHGGYIPWDDDIDLSMSREDYDKLPKILEKSFRGTGLKFAQSEIMRIFYKDTALQVDIFPFDFYDRKIEDNQEKIDLYKKITDLHFKYIKFDWTRVQGNVVPGLSYDKMKEIRRRYICRDVEYKEALKNHFSIFHGFEKEPDFSRYLHVYDFDWIYPLQELDFMGEKMLAPNNPDVLLSLYYGDYMAWPSKMHPKHEDIQSRVSFETVEEVKRFIAS